MFFIFAVSHHHYSYAMTMTIDWSNQPICLYVCVCVCVCVYTCLSHIKIQWNLDTQCKCFIINNFTFIGLLWQFVEIIVTKKSKSTIITCKEFHSLQQEKKLIQHFYKKIINTILTKTMTGTLRNSWSCLINLVKYSVILLSESNMMNIWIVMRLQEFRHT